ncbi:MAG: type II toxin-antitoxin system ParD family antitoxin [Thiolinea sp.]
MPRNTSITLGKHFESFVDNQVNTGHYHSVSEVIRAGLRLLEERELKIQNLRGAIIAGEQSGKPVPFDPGAFKQEMRDELKDS